MITLFRKLNSEKKLKKNGSLLDLGCGNGKVSEPFLGFGYTITLVDSNAGVLEEVEKNFSSIKKDGYTTVHGAIEKFEFNDTYDGIIISNVLPFQKEKTEITRIIHSAFNALHTGGFLFFTLFGTEDDWAKDKKDTMSFYTKNEALDIMEGKPYFISEDYGKGSTMKGNIKNWHIFSLLYFK